VRIAAASVAGVPRSPYLVHAPIVPPPAGLRARILERGSGRVRLRYAMGVLMPGSQVVACCLP
jgi:hypothetical protein